MGFGPMMSSLMRSKTGPILVAVQIAVTLAIVVNSTFIILQRVEKMNRETGIDVENVIIAYVRGFADDFDVVDSITNDMTLLKSIPGVVTATVSNHVPLSGSGSGTGLRTVPDETIESVGTARYQWGEDGLEALGVELSRGRNFYPEEINFDLPADDSPTPPSVLVTQELADFLYPDEDALGKIVYWGSMEQSTIVGIIGHMHGSWVSWDKLGSVVVQPGMPATTTNKYVIRAEPGMRDELIPIIEQKLAESNRGRVVKSVRSLEQMAGTFLPTRSRYGDHSRHRGLLAGWHYRTGSHWTVVLSRHAAHQANRYAPRIGCEASGYRQAIHTRELDYHDGRRGVWRNPHGRRRLLAGNIVLATQTRLGLPAHRYRYAMDTVYARRNRTGSPRCSGTAGRCDTECVKDSR